MKTALVTGANKGIGFDIVKRLNKQGFFVYLASRNVEKGLEAVNRLKAEGANNIEHVIIDVTDLTSIENAASSIANNIDHLDVLINNAGISGEIPQSALTSSAEEFQKVLNTNLLGVMRVTQVFLSLLKKSAAPRIVNVTSAMASLSLAGDLQNENYPQRYALYQTSKAALNMYTINVAYELLNTPFKVNAVCPGYTRTDFTNHEGTSSVEEASARIVKYALIDENGPTGKFFSEEYYSDPASCPW